MIRASAPSKLTLFGEHAIAYGEPAIATAMDKRAYVTACELDGQRIVIESKNLGTTIEATLEEKATDPIVKAVQAAVKGSGKKIGIGIEIDSEVPIGSGMGSSAAVATATAAAVTGLLNDNLVTMEVAEIAYAAEKLTRAKASGIDSAITTFGGTILFQKGMIKNVPINQELVLVVGDTGRESNTKELLDKVSKHIEDPMMAHSMFSIGALVRKANGALMSGNPLEIGKMMDMNHMFLRNLGVSTQTLENLVNAAKEAGAFGAKLTGAGGGGCVIALTDNPAEVAGAMKRAGATKAFKAQTNQEGVRIES